MRLGLTFDGKLCGQMFLFEGGQCAGDGEYQYRPLDAFFSFVSAPMHGMQLQVTIDLCRVAESQAEPSGKTSMEIEPIVPAFRIR